MLLLVLAIRRTLILLQQSKIAPLARKGLVRRELDDIDTGFGGSAHGGVQEAEEGAEGLDQEFGEVVEHVGGVCSEGAGVGEVAWVYGDGGDEGEVCVLFFGGGGLLAAVSGGLGG